MRQRLAALVLAAAVLAGLFGCGAAEPEPVTYGNLAITEVMASNKTALRDAYGEYPDWVEITNQGDAPVELKDYCLTKGQGGGSVFQFPDTELLPGEIVVVYCSDREDYAASVYHAPFNLGKGGEDLSLRHADGTVVSEFSYSDAQADRSLLPDGTATARITPGYPNDETGYLSFLGSQRMPEGLMISEVMNTNEDVIAHDEDVYSDWVELYNNSAGAVDLSQYYLSDDDDQLQACRLPDRMLEPYGYTVIFCDDPDESFTEFVTGFGLSTDDQVFLSGPEGLLDAMAVSGIPAGYSYGRTPGQGLAYYANPTPGAANGQGWTMIAETPVPSVPQGVYDDADSLTVSLRGEGTIYYTTDGSEPTRSSQIYSAPFELTKSAVIRAYAVSDDKLDSPIMTASYIIGEHHTLPVVALVTDKKNLYDEETGIYVEGVNDNLYEDWERPANVSLFEGGAEVFGANCGIQLFGHSTRYEEKKSLRVNFRSKYGNSGVKADIFGDGVNKYKSFVLRGGNEEGYSIFVSEILTSLAKGTHLLTQSDKYCVVYLNGEFFGIFCLIERFSPTYYATHVGAEEYTVEKIEHATLGDQAMSRLIEYVETHDMSLQSSLEYVEAQVDLDSMIDWYTFQAYGCHKDSGNVKWMLADGHKIQYCFHDLDLSFQAREDWYGYLDEVDDHTVMMRYMLENSTFRARFINRTAEILNTVLTDENVLARIEYYYNLLKPEIPRERALWYTDISSEETWERDVENLRSYVRDQDIHEEMINSLDEKIGLTNEEIAILRGEQPYTPSSQFDSPGAAMAPAATESPEPTAEAAG